MASAKGPAAPLRELGITIQTYVELAAHHSGSVVAVVIILAALYAAYCKIQRAKRRRQHSRREGFGVDRGQPLLPVQKLSPKQRYLEVRPGSKSKVLLGSEVVFGNVEEQKEISIRDDAREILHSLCRCSDVFLIYKDNGNDNSEDEHIKRKVQKTLLDIGLVDAGFKLHRIIICSTVMGKAHVARHLMPDLYIDVDAEPLKAVQQHIEDTVMLKRDDSKSGKSLVQVDSLASFFNVAPEKNRGCKAEVIKPQSTLRQRSKK